MEATADNWINGSAAQDRVPEVTVYKFYSLFKQGS